MSEWGDVGSTTTDRIRQGSPPTTLYLETDASASSFKARKREDGKRLVRSGAGIVLRTTDSRRVATYAVELGYIRSAYLGEFLALKIGLEKAISHGATGVLARSDLEGLVKTVNGAWELRAKEIRPTFFEIVSLKSRFHPFELRWTEGYHRLRRSDGILSADALAKIASGVSYHAELPEGVILEKVGTPSKSKQEPASSGLFRFG